VVDETHLQGNTQGWGIKELIEVDEGNPQLGIDIKVCKDE